MADPWELILHHAYVGTPGVVFDQSPGRGSHGVAVNVPDADFLSDGAQPGSGAINLQRTSMIRVRATKAWNPLRAVRAEVVCIRDVAGGTDVMIDADSFTFSLRGDGFGARFSSYPHYAEIWTHFNAFDPTFEVPTGRWMTLGFLHDGVSTMELYVDGQTVARLSRPLWPINTTTAVTIGNFTSTPTFGLAGRIDDVKVWRIDPHRVDQEFTGRPVDDSVKTCWAEWSHAFGEVLDEHRDCEIRLRQMLVRAVDGILRDGLNHGDQTRDRWRSVADDYRRLWSAGTLADIVPILADLISFLQLAGLDPLQNPDVIALLGEPCLKTIADQVPPMYCDDQFSDMIENLTKTVEKRNRNQHVTTKVRGTENRGT
ncbi:hypothetical protein TUM20985_19080 [Mycobacterium antarcticum]|uniref:LamG-like jellyroll fold domain-containing protein n=1 Tax=Mycolicibacterium sp. TUM20985 TaxID=3023370 RepID=UPI0025728FE6|nr:LamG-like jellyroll fold domain-containing protein [Mycolicibacterium sp. TUM20985]BDX31361.1 hypothetical protein TUM20985_19080 [Mycolicibacterium sp. TUM20985]